MGIQEFGNLEHGNMGICECGEWEFRNLDTCASATRSLGNNLTQSIKKYGCLKMWKTYGNYGDLQRSKAY